MTIKMIETLVYYSPTRKRRYFSKRGAIKAEANARIYKKYPKEEQEYHEGNLSYPGYDIACERPVFYSRAIRYLSYLLRKQ
ncbi:hypothetical protein ACR71G_22100 [Xenorhabdus bovienii]|uniref:hypothetical protein n=1 Tax=Xenorhabdus bovienii TaxID=40576 RepID=UPI003DA55109